jgi:2,3-dihydroxy-p-cumate/2,3-dihydroxybenzoate 3,4-dioxygenase
VTDILRIGHVVLGTPSVDDTAAWLMKELGFRCSDYIENGFFSFLRCHPNPYHHSLALTFSPTNKFHHVAFMVKDIGDIGKAIHRFPKQNIKVVYGPGRHVASGSVFYYFLDPDGMTVEYTYGMEEFAETTPRPNRTLVKSPQTADEWGSLPTGEYGKIGRIESTAL